MIVPGFDVLTPDDSFLAEEKNAIVYMKGEVLHYIPADGPAQFCDLPAKLTELIKQCWAVASVSNGAQRNANVQIGGNSARANQLPDKMRQVQGSWKPADIFEANRLQSNQQSHNYVKQVQPIPMPAPNHPHLSGIARDWKLTSDLPRVNAFTFRGDSRGPVELSAADGFHPPITRGDQYYVDNTIFPQFQDYMRRRFQVELTRVQFNRIYSRQIVSHSDRVAMLNFCVWRSMVEQESFHIGRMIYSEALKAYISTTKFVPVAKRFANPNGWVYVTRVCGGFTLPDGHTWNIHEYEQEIAHLGPLPWNEIYGFRQRDGGKGKFVGPVYLRKGFESSQPAAAKQVFEALSGKAQ